MIVDWFLVLAGLALLVGGGEALVRGASGIALLSRLSPAVVGPTIVAAGTSMPAIGSTEKRGKWVASGLLEPTRATPLR